MKRSYRRPLTFAAAVIFLLLTSRVFVSIIESLSVVAEERRADADLLTLCASDSSAKSSPKLRSACLSARRDHASPLLLKAVARALSLAFDEFRTQISSPSGLGSVLLFVVSGLLMPLLRPLKLLVKAIVDEGRGRRQSKRRDHESDSESDDENAHRILLLEDHAPQLSRRASKRLHSEFL